jgi:hypothetical protein
VTKYLVFPPLSCWVSAFTFFLLLLLLLRLSSMSASPRCYFGLITSRKDEARRPTKEAKERDKTEYLAFPPLRFSEDYSLEAACNFLPSWEERSLLSAWNGGFWGWEYFSFFPCLFLSFHALSLIFFFSYLCT